MTKRRATAEGPGPAGLLAGLPREGPLRLAPTDVTQFVRMEQCERFLRFRLAERAGQTFMKAYDVGVQRITPLLSQSGSDFEVEIEDALERTFRTTHYAAKSGMAHNRPDNNREVVEEARRLPPGQVVLLFQPRVDVQRDGWHLRGDVDLLRLERSAEGTLHLLVVDMKSTAQVKVEHRLQVAFYRLMLEQLLHDAGLAHAPIQTGILYRLPVDPAPDEQAEIQKRRDAACGCFGLEQTLLEIVAEPQAYVQSAHDLVLGPDSTAHRVAQAPFEEVPYCLSFKCDGCLYNEFCMKWSAEREDLSLLPYMTAVDKQALGRAGIRTIQDLATLKDFAPPASDHKPNDLVPAPGREGQVQQIAGSWSVGPRLDELVHRARKFRRSMRQDEMAALGDIPGKGNSTLPVSTSELNPNLVVLYVDAQQDYLEGRVYLLGALVVARKDGVAVARRSVVRMTDGPPDSAAKERQLFIDWTRELVRVVVELAVPGPGEGEEKADQKKSAPIHVVFFDRHEQDVLLEALARNFPPILQQTPPLYDFLTQVAAFDSPIATFLAEELRTFKNLPMTCQSLQSVAAYLKFDWNKPQPFRELFKARLFDYLAKLDIEGQLQWYTRRARFSSSVPLEYAYAAWGQLPRPGRGKGDEFADFRGATAELLTAFQERRLQALEHVAGSIRGNPNTAKTPFVLPDLANFSDLADDLAHALDEFVTIERLVELNDWKAARHAPPEQRVLMGDCLLVEYRESDQEPAAAEQNRENDRRQKKREALKAAQPDPSAGLSQEQAAACHWSPEGLRLRLRVRCEGTDCDLHQALLLSNLRTGDQLVLYSRWTVDERLRAEERKPFTPTPKQMLYGQRARLAELRVTAKDGAGRAQEAFAEVELTDEQAWACRPFVFGGINRPLEDGKLYTLDPCPNAWYAYWCARVVAGLCEGRSNVLYDRLVQLPAPGDGAGLPGQQAFLAGLEAFGRTGHLHELEPSKKEFIGRHGQTPVLLVQGPPGTGKSYGTAFAIFARLQAAMREGRPLRVFLSCKTHAATDVLLKNVLEVREKLRGLRKADRKLFAKHFDNRLLNVPLYRIAPQEAPPAGVVPLAKDDEKEAGESRNADVIMQEQWAVVAATPGGIYGMLKKKWKDVFGHELCDLLVLDEASQMNLPEAILAALPLKRDAPLIVVGDHRQMPPIVKHDWQAEARRTFQQYRVYESLFDALRAQKPPMIRFAESFRLHAAVAEFLRQEIYHQDGIRFHSNRHEVLPAHPIKDELTAAVLRPDYPLVVVTHDEADSQMRNPFEQALIEPILRVLVDQYGLGPRDGLGVVVPHRAQRAALQEALPRLGVPDGGVGPRGQSAIDTVERFQGGERTVILVSATESDRAYLLASSAFLLDPRRLTVAVSRARCKMIVIAAQSIFTLFSPDEETFANARLWKDLLLRACTTLLWQGRRDGRAVAVWGGKATGGPGDPVPEVRHE